MGVEIEQREIDAAFNRTILINQLKRESSRNVFRLGEQLYLVLQDFKNLGEGQLEAIYGYCTFNAYLGAPERSGGVDIARSTAFVFIGLYEKFMLELKVHHDGLPGDWNKLELIRPIISQENVEEWLSKAEALSRSDLREEIKEYYRKEKAQFYEQNPLPVGKYRVFYADPPWQYNDSGLQEYGHAEFHYPTLSIEELCDLPIKSMAEDDAVLFLWVTSPLLEEAFTVIRAWGFEYKSSFVWDKVRHNFGHYNSLRHEFLLICTRGSCTPDVLELFDSVQSIERTEKHSEKPEEFRKIIERLYVRRTEGEDFCELFGRKKVNGWKIYGNETQD